MAAYLHRQAISVIPYLNDFLIHHPDRQVLLCHQSQLVNTLNIVGLKFNKSKSELQPVHDIQFLGLWLHLNQGRAISKAREIIAHVCQISSQSELLYTEVSQFMGSLNWASGLIPLGRHEAPTMTLLFTRSDRPVCSPVSTVLATLLKQWQDLSFLTSVIPIWPFQANFTIFTDASTQDWGPHMGDAQISGVWAHSELKLHIIVL